MYLLGVSCAATSPHVLRNYIFPHCPVCDLWVLLILSLESDISGINDLHVGVLAPYWLDTDVKGTPHIFSAWFGIPHWVPSMHRYAYRSCHMVPIICFTKTGVCWQILVKLTNVICVKNPFTSSWIITADRHLSKLMGTLLKFQLQMCLEHHLIFWISSVC